MVNEEDNNYEGINIHKFDKIIEIIVINYSSDYLLGNNIINNNHFLGWLNEYINIYYNL